MMPEKQQYNNSDFKGKEDHEATPTASACGFPALKTVFKRRNSTVVNLGGATSAGSGGTSVCRRNQRAALGRSPAARDTPPDGGSAPPQTAAGT